MSRDDITQIEKLALLLSLGLCVAIKNKAVSIDDAEYLLYSPKVMNRLEEFGINKKVIELIHQGTELENLARLIPDELDRSLSEMKKQSLDMIKALPMSNVDQPKWIEKFNLDD